MHEEPELLQVLDWSTLQEQTTFHCEFLAMPAGSSHVSLELLANDLLYKFRVWVDEQILRSCAKYAKIVASFDSTRAKRVIEEFESLCEENDRKSKTLSSLV